MTDNYTASYARGAAEGASDKFSLYPRGFQSGDLAADDESLQ